MWPQRGIEVVEHMVVRSMDRVLRWRRRAEEYNTTRPVAEQVYGGRLLKNEKYFLKNKTTLFRKVR
jgi:hypothetical protein